MGEKTSFLSFLARDSSDSDVVSEMLDLDQVRRISYPKDKPFSEKDLPSGGKIDVYRIHVYWVGLERPTFFLVDNDTLLNIRSDWGSYLSCRAKNYK